MAQSGAAGLDRILKSTSRSFYLTLKVAPRRVRRQLRLAYLFCRAADTIADTALLPEDRRGELLALYRRQFEREEPEPDSARVLAGSLADSAGSSGERSLLLSLDRSFAELAGLGPGDRALIRRLVTTLTRGMEIDLRSFPPSAGRAHTGGPGPEGDRFPLPQPLPDLETLDRYCYHVAGCVGEFWTDLAAAHLPALAGWDLPAMRALGVRFGKGLQMTNVLRDLPRDLREGRSYLPRTLLEREGLEPARLKGGGRPGAPLPPGLIPILEELLDLTLSHYRAGWEYTLSIPRSAPRLRLACGWPLLIGLPTLALIRNRPGELLAGATLKVSRKRVRQLLFASSLAVFSDSALDRLYRRLEEAALSAASGIRPAAPLPGRPR
jgi:farnesyl-diphosphate farnesyltransferase